MPLTYAIDFGTSNSLLAAADEKTLINPIPLDPHSIDPTVFRTLLYFPTMKKVYYGTEAIKQYTENQGQGRLIRSVKKHLPVRSFIGTWIEDRPMNLEDLIALFLENMRKKANEHFQMDVDSVVIGRPAIFSENEADDKFAESRLEISAQKAGFKNIYFFPEPLAAAYEFRTQMTEEKLVLVGDFGAGTSDYTVIKMHSGKFHPSDVLAIGGVPKAGDALDSSIMRNRLSTYFGAGIQFKIPFGSNTLTMPAHLIEKICSPADVSLLMNKDIKEYLEKVQKYASRSEDKNKIQNLFTLIGDQLGFSIFESIEKAKRELSAEDKVMLSYQYPTLDIKEEITEKEFISYNTDCINQMMTALDDTLKKAGVTYSQIDIICCTGGTAKVRAIQNELARRFGIEKLTAHNHFHSVVKGLAIQAQELSR